MEHRMTEGSVARQIVSFSAPIILGNIFQQLYNTADAMIVGRLIGNEAFAAVSVANPIMSVVLFFFVGLSMGVGVLLAQRFGAGDERAFRVQYSTALIAGAVFTTAVSLICIACSRAMLLAANTPPEILAETDRYLKIVFAGLFFSFLYNYLASALRSIGDSRTAFAFLVLSAAVNVALDYVLVKYSSLGVSGAAAATVISQALSAALCVVYIYRRIPALALRKGEFVFERRVLKTIAVFSWASALQQTFLYFGRLLVQGTINGLGTDMITGYNAAIRLEAFLMAFIDGTGNALATFSGQNLGAGKSQRLRQGLFRTAGMNLLFMVLGGGIMLAMPEALIGMYVDASHAEAVRLGVTYITVMPAVYLLCGMNSAMQGFFRGIGRIKVTMIATCSQIVVRCVLTVLFVPVYGIYGVCFSVAVGWILMFFYDSALCVRYFRRDAGEKRREE